MKGKKKTTTLILGAICTMSLIGRSVFAMENRWIRDDKEPTVSTKGDGESYSREELAEKLGMTLDEFDKEVKTHEFSLTDSSSLSGKVENDVLTQ